MRFKIGDRFMPRIPKMNMFAKKSENPLKDVELKPKLRHGEEHPLPYYESGEITLAAFTGPPWQEEVKKEEQAKFEKMMTDPKIARHFRDAFLKEAVEVEVMAAASSVLAEKKNERTRDETAVLLMEEEFLVPGVQLEVFLSVWELLYDWGRNLPVEEYHELQKREERLEMNDNDKRALTAHMFEGKNWSDDLKEEKKLSGHKWDTILYNYHSKLQQSSFKRNVALHILQEKIVGSTAADEVLEGVLTYLERDMVHLDEKEKVESPPRKSVN